MLQYTCKFSRAIIEKLIPRSGLDLAPVYLSFHLALAYAGAGCFPAGGRAQEVDAERRCRLPTARRETEN